MQKNYTPVPIPLKQRLREIRVRVIPLAVFLMVGVAVFFLWENQVSSPAMIGEVVGDRSTVASPASGILINFYYNDFDRIEEGQLIGQIYRQDTLYVNAQLSLLRAESDLIRESMDIGADDMRNRSNLEDLKIEELNSRIALAATRLRKQQADLNYRRAAELYERDLIAEQEYELAKMELELLSVEVSETEDLIEFLGERVRENEEFQRYDTRADRDPILAAIRVQEQKMETLLAESAPLPIYAPISGIVSMVNHKTGEYVAAGDSLLRIESAEPAYIVGYMRQPFTVQPEAGMAVEVRTRKPGRASFESNIEQLGGHARMIDSQLQRPGAIYESGLPVKIPVNPSADITLTPGEIVDIVLRPGW
ncbi:MAG: HlyD family efflux transporter periplasmic adaptor subunit [Balneolaceae bacterium]|nr:MAG: HlyD family efflux transporter periplasmic adaptor subunit [Balneolaceae bacterium]